MGFGRPITRQSASANLHTIVLRNLGKLELNQERRSSSTLRRGAPGPDQYPAGCYPPCAAVADPQRHDRTATTPVAHGLNKGDVVSVFGADQRVRGSADRDGRKEHHVHLHDRDDAGDPGDRLFTVRRGTDTRADATGDVAAGDHGDQEQDRLGGCG